MYKLSFVIVPHHFWLACCMNSTIVMERRIKQDLFGGFNLRLQDCFIIFENESNLTRLKKERKKIKTIECTSRKVFSAVFLDLIGFSSRNSLGFPVRCFRKVPSKNVRLLHRYDPKRLDVKKLSVIMQRPQPKNPVANSFTT